MNALYLIRHAQPIVAEYDNFFPGPGLGETGKRQSEWVAEFLRGKSLRRIYHSDFPRVLETMAPFLRGKPEIPALTPVQAMREREPSAETHESLVQRVHTWMRELELYSMENIAIFSHCGPINMILNYYESMGNTIHYPFTSPHGCHTPLAGIWELTFEKTRIDANLHFCPVV